MTTQIIGTKELAEKLNTTVDAIRCHINRKTPGALPPHFKRGRILCWNLETVDKWIKSKDAAGQKAFN